MGQQQGYGGQPGYGNSYGGPGGNRGVNNYASPPTPVSPPMPRMPAYVRKQGYTPPSQDRRSGFSYDQNSQIAPGMNMASSLKPKASYKSHVEVYEPDVPMVSAGVPRISAGVTGQQLQMQQAYPKDCH